MCPVTIYIFIVTPVTRHTHWKKHAIPKAEETENLRFCELPDIKSSHHIRSVTYTTINPLSLSSTPLLTKYSPHHTKYSGHKGPSSPLIHPFPRAPLDPVKTPPS